MEQEKAISLLNRQLTDILANAERIINGSDSSEEIEQFARYSIELKKFVNEKIDNDDLKTAINEIPDINYQRTEIQMWQYIVLPAWWLSLYNDYQARLETKEEVNTVRNKFSNFQLLIRGYINA